MVCAVFSHVFRKYLASYTLVSVAIASSLLTCCIQISLGKTSATKFEIEGYNVADLTHLISTKLVSEVQSD